MNQNNSNKTDRGIPSLGPTGFLEKLNDDLKQFLKKCTLYIFNAVVA